jgi:hypothetical protein
MKVVGFWSNIMSEAKRIGKLRTEGKYEEAAKLEKELMDNVRKMDSVVLNVSNGTSMP